MRKWKTAGPWCCGFSWYFHEKIRDALVAVPCSDVVIRNRGLLTIMSDFTSD